MLDLDYQETMTCVGFLNIAGNEQIYFSDITYSRLQNVDYIYPNLRINIPSHFEVKLSELF